MSLPFVNRAPSADEQTFLALMVSTFTDGSGNHRELDGRSRAGWRELERICGEFLTGKKHSEDKHVFDVIAPDWDDGKTNYGLSIKSKQLKGKKSIFNSNLAARAYLELANSPAKMWEAITKKTGFDVQTFAQQARPQELGNALIQTLGDWKLAAKNEFEREAKDKKLDIEQSVYLAISFSEYDGESWFIHFSSFSMTFPAVDWYYSSPKCLSANDPAYPNERLLDWYPNSGGQLKFYPRFSEALYSGEPIRLHTFEEVSILGKTLLCFGDKAADLFSRLDSKQVGLIGHLISPR